MHPIYEPIRILLLDNVAVKISKGKGAKKLRLFMCSTNVCWFFPFMELTKTFVSILIRAGGAPLGAHSILQCVSVHAKQAIRPQRAFAGIAAPVTLWKKTEG